MLKCNFPVEKSYLYTKQMNMEVTKKTVEKTFEFIETLMRDSISDKERLIKAMYALGKPKAAENMVSWKCLYEDELSKIANDLKQEYGIH